MPLGTSFSPLPVDSVRDRLRIKSSCFIAGFSYALSSTVLSVQSWAQSCIVHCVILPRITLISTE